MPGASTRENPQRPHGGGDSEDISNPRKGFYGQNAAKRNRPSRKIAFEATTPSIIFVLRKKKLKDWGAHSLPILSARSDHGLE